VTTADRVTNPRERGSVRRRRTPANGGPPERGALHHPTSEERAAKGKAARAAAPRGVHAMWEPSSDRRDPVDLLEEQAASRVRVNDFDETLPGPFEWDVKRLVASFAVAGRDRGFNANQRRSINATAARSYRTAMTAFAEMGNLEVWYARIQLEDLARAARRGNAKQIKQFERNVAKARSKDSLKAFTKLTELVDGEPRILTDPPLIVPVEDVVPEAEHHRLDDFIRDVVRRYRRTLTADRRQLLERFRYVHMARKVVGVGSVGTRAWIMLLLGRDAQDPLFLQFKEAEASVLEPFLGESPFANHGQRVVEGQRLTQAASDIMLGWIRATDLAGQSRDYYIRQLWDAKGSALVELMDPKALTIYAELCGRTLAKAHARSGDAIAIASYLGRRDRFDRPLASFAESYADQNERDYDALRAAVASGRVVAESGL
jgi:uncharacterized protein (DUF2252 family)